MQALIKSEHFILQLIKKKKNVVELTCVKNHLCRTPVSIQALLSLYYFLSVSLFCTLIKTLKTSALPFNMMRSKCISCKPRQNDGCHVECINALTAVALFLLSFLLLRNQRRSKTQSTCVGTTSSFSQTPHQ